MDSPQLALDVGLTERSTFQNFFTGNNAALVRVLREMTEGGGERQTLLWGGAGSGKSHLLHAVCHRAADHGLRVQYLPLSVLPKDIDTASVLMLAEQDVLCLDQIDEVLGEAHGEEMLFHLINACRERACRLILALTDNPQFVEIGLPDLASRLVWGPVFQLRSLNDEEKLVALVERAEQRGFELPVEAAEYLLRHTARDLGNLMQILERIDEASLTAKRRVTLPFVRQLVAAGA